MRAIGFFGLAVFCLDASGASAQAWKEYAYDSWGFAAQFPAEPTVEQRAYPSANGVGVVEHVFSVDQGGVVYLVSVADFSKTRADKNKTIDEAVNALTAKGRLTIDYPGRIDLNYGREVAVKDNDGTTYTDAVFFVDKKLYQIEVVYPLKNTDPAGSSGIGYFQTAFRFLP